MKMNKRNDECVFCDIVAGDKPAVFVDEGDGFVIIEPLQPYVPGHLLVLPTDHVCDALESLTITGLAMDTAIRYMRGSKYEAFNLLTSIGMDATQTIFHLHWHILPRDENDGLELDWPWCR